MSVYTPVIKRKGWCFVVWGTMFIYGVLYARVKLRDTASFWKSTLYEMVQYLGKRLGGWVDKKARVVDSLQQYDNSAGSANKVAESLFALAKWG